MTSKTTPVSDTEVSKHLSYILRHKPDSIGLSLDGHGWACVDELLQCLERQGYPLDRQRLEKIVRESDKQRFNFSEDKTRIRASHGHSLPSVSLGYANRQPPALLFHGTARRNVASILSQGLLPMDRHFVHLTESLAVAREVGSRHGKVAILEVAAGRMFTEGYAFSLSDSGVWLTGTVPPEYIREIAPS